MSVLGIDISYWQDPAKVPYAELSKHGFCFVVIKASMGGGYDIRCDAHVAAAKAAGWKLGLYHWCDPIQSAVKQAAFFVDKIRLHDPDFLWYDVEQYWASWQDHTKILTPDQIVWNAQSVIDEVRGAGIDKPQAIYTGKWFMDVYVKQPWPWTLTDAALAQYTTYGGVVTWDYFDNTILPALKPPTLAAGLTSWRFRQFDSNIKLPPGYINYDLDWFNGTIEEFHDWLGKPMANWADLLPGEKLDGPVLRLLKAHGYVTQDGKVVGMLPPVREE